jgi:putative flippase GtrA
MRRLVGQIAAFTGVGVVAAIVHYGLLVGLVEVGGVKPVPATLAGYVAGGFVSYILNRRHTFDSGRSHVQAGWRFAFVAGIGFLLTGLLMHVLHDRLGVPYLPAQVLTTGVVLFWSFLANRFWTFRS